MTLRVEMGILNPLMLSLLLGMAPCQTFVILYLRVHAAQLRYKARLFFNFLRFGD